MYISRLLLILLLILPGSAIAELDIHNAWIKNLPPAVPVRAGYMTIRNTQANALGIVAIRSDAFASVEIHRTIAADGMMRMEAVPTLVIEPDATVQLAPGGLHLMMMNPAEPTKPGDVLQIVIEFDDGSTQDLNMTVKK
jgi:copper(I)-binding protein